MKILIVDDEPVNVGLLANALKGSYEICTALSGDVAISMIKEQSPDLVLLDVMMPEMDGLQVCRLIRADATLAGIPVIFVTAMDSLEDEVRGLELGAVDFVSKPRVDIARGIAGAGVEIVDKIRAAVGARLTRPAAGAAAAVRRLTGGQRYSTEKLIIVGASTGGTEALRVMLEQLPADAPAVLVTQHMAAGFTRTFAARLDSLCRITVKEAAGEERVLPGHAYIAPGDRHLLLKRSGANYMTGLDDGPPVNRHRPSVEVLFRSAARHAGPNAVGVMLTGMGKDGATAMLEMHQAGAFNIAQDEASCVVFGMPKEAIAVGAVDQVLPLEDIAQCAMHQFARMGGGAVRV